jgi:hypothetical protein
MSRSQCAPEMPLVQNTFHIRETRLSRLDRAIPHTREFRAQIVQREQERGGLVRAQK